MGEEQLRVGGEETAIFVKLGQILSLPVGEQ
jgi:hypothetical protein